jgi:hypothetical protein
MKMQECIRAAAVLVVECVGGDPHAGRRLQQPAAFGHVLHLIIRAERLQAIRQIESLAETRGLRQRKPRTQIDNYAPLICCLHWQGPRTVSTSADTVELSGLYLCGCVRQDGYLEI